MSGIPYGNSDNIVTQLTQEQVQDYVNGVIVGGTNVTATYNDGAGTLTLDNAATNLAHTADGGSFVITSSTGNNVSLPAATTSAWGIMTDNDKSKLDNIADNANNYSLPTAEAGLVGGVKVGTNLRIDGSSVLHVTPAINSKVYGGFYITSALSNFTVSSSNHNITGATALSYNNNQVNINTTNATLDVARSGVYKINYKVSYVGDSGSNSDFLTVNTTLMGNIGGSDTVLDYIHYHGNNNHFHRMCVSGSWVGSLSTNDTVRLVLNNGDDSDSINVVGGSSGLPTKLEIINVD